MATTITLRFLPAATLSTCAYVVGAPGPVAQHAHEAVLTNDGDDSYVYAQSVNKWGLFVFALTCADPMPATLEQISVTVRALVKSSATIASYRQCRLHILGTSDTSTPYPSPALAIAAGDYAWYTWTWSTNPRTNQAWTLADLSTLTGGILDADTYTYWQCTQLEVVVTGTQPSTPPTCTLTVHTAEHRTLSVMPSASATEGTLADITLHWGDGTVTAAVASGTVVTHTYPATGGTFGVSAIATSTNGLEGSSEVIMVVISPNIRPACVFAVESDVQDARRITVTTAASTDPDGSVTEVVYVMAGPDPEVGEPPASAWTVGTLGMPITYQYPTAGAYWLWVRVTDNEGATDWQVASIDAWPAPPQVALVVASDDPRTIRYADLSQDRMNTARQVTIAWGDGTEVVVVSPDDVVPHTYPLRPTQMTYVIRVTAQWDDGASAATTRDIWIAGHFVPQPGDRAPGSRCTERDQTEDTLR